MADAGPQTPQAAPRTVTLKGPDGNLYDFPEDKAAEAQQKGFTAPAPAEAEPQTGTVGAAVTSALRGATLGLSDYVLTAKHMVSPEYLQAQKEEHPLASGLGEAAGMIGGAALGGVPAGGASLLGRATEGGVSKILGEAATESLARRLVTKATTKAAGSAVEAAYLSTGQLVSEDTLGQANLNAEKVLAHLGVSALLGGALGGALGAGEAAVGAAARKAAAGRRALTDEDYLYHVTPKVNERSIDAQGLRPDATKIGEGGPHANTRAVFLGDKGTAETYQQMYGPGDVTTYRVPRASIRGLEDDTLSEGNAWLTKQAIGPGGMEKLTGNTWAPVQAKSGFLEDLADESAVKATAARGADLRRLMSKDKLRQVGRDMREYVLDDGRKIIDEGLPGIVTRNDTEGMLERLQAAKQQAGEKLGAFRDQVNAVTEANPELQPKVQDFLDQVREQVVDPALASKLPSVRARAQDVIEQLSGVSDENIAQLKATAKPLRASRLNRMTPEQVVQHWNDTGDPLRWTLSQFEDLRQDLAKIVYPKMRPGQGIPPPLPQSVEELRKTERILADFIDQHTERVVKEVQPELAGQYATLRRQYSSLSTAAGLTGKADMMDIGNRWLSPSDYFTAAAAALGGDGASMARGLAAGIAHKLIRERGRAVVSVMAGRAAQLAGVERAVGSVSSRVAKSIDGFVSGLEGGAEHIAAAAAVPSSAAILRDVSFAPPGIKAAQTDDPVDAFKARAAELTRAVQNPAALSDALAAAVAPIEPVAPKLAAQLTQKGVAAAQFLASKLPKNPGQPGLLMARDRDQWRPSATDLATFSRYVRAAQHPLTILDDLRGGNVSSEAVETIKTLYPQLYAEIGRQLSTRVAELKASVPYAKRARLAQLFGTPIDATTRPDFVADLQQTFAMLDNQPGGREGGVNFGGGPHSSVATNLSTPVDRIMSQ